MWLGSLNMLPPVLMKTSIIISAIQVIVSICMLIFMMIKGKGGIMKNKSLFNKRVWNLGGRKSCILA